MPVPSARLIPRYNWDYRLADFLPAMFSAFEERADVAKALAAVFGERPLLTTSGRASLYLILKCLGLKAGAPVGVPLFCCPVVFDTVVRAGFRPIFIDVNDEDFTVSLADLSRKIAKIEALIVVHMFGNVARTDKLISLCGRKPLVEDCAHALYSKMDGRYAGLDGTCSFFSFRSGKYLSAGEGSAIFCRDAAVRSRLEEHAQEIADWGIGEGIFHSLEVYLKSMFYRKPLYGLVGYPLGRKLDRSLNLTSKEGFRMKTMSRGDARIIHRRIEPYRYKILQQRDNALYFLSRLQMHNAVLPREPDGGQSNYYQFALRFDKQGDRDAAADYLFSRGIDTAKYSDGVPDLARLRFGYAGDCPDAERCSRTTLVVPNHYNLTRAEIDHIVDSLHELDAILS